MVYTYTIKWYYLNEYDIYPYYRKKPLLLDYNSGVISELEEEDMDLDDVVYVLENGFDCPRSKRRREALERCIQKKNRIIKVVAIETDDYWLLRHVGSFKLSKKKRKRYAT